VIDTRHELILALREAAEIEHGLMIQYLFPALTMKKRLDEGVSAMHLSLMRSWEATILGVAVEEMGHLGTVCNLLAAIGESPQFGRPNFPQTVGYYPFPFDLVEFGDETLYRMLVFELPRGEPLPPPPHMMAAETVALSVAPDPLKYQYVGELYEKISQGFQAVPEAELFIGPPTSQVADTWSIRLDLRPVVDRASALAAIEDIILDGEGAPGDRIGSHYDRFHTIRTQYAEQNWFTAARPVVRNPQTRPHRDADTGGTLLTDELTVRVAEVFNIAYATTLMLLQQFFTSAGESAEQREVLKGSAGQLMSTAIRPLAEILTELPAFAGDSGGPTAGPSFELYDEVTVSPFLTARWTILLERLAAVAAEARSIGTQVPRVGAVGETMSFLQRRIAEVAP
jgi:hypothetical protein